MTSIIQKCGDHKRQKRQRNVPDLGDRETTAKLNLRTSILDLEKDMGGQLVKLDKIWRLVNNIIVNVNFLILLIVPWLGVRC